MCKDRGDESSLFVPNSLPKSPPPCPSCGSKHTVKTGMIHNGKQNHRCRDCGRQFVLDPQQKRISEETKILIDKLLLEKIPLAGIARFADVSKPWLQNYVNEKYAAVPQKIEVRSKKRPFEDRMRGVYRFLVVLRGVYSEQEASCGGKRKRKNEPHRETELYTTAKDIEASKKNSVILQKA